MRQTLTSLPLFVVAFMAGACASSNKPAPAAPITPLEAALPAPTPPPIEPAPEPNTGAAVLHFLRAKYDQDKDGRIAQVEYVRSAEAFRRLDVDGDGFISAADFDKRFDGMPRAENFVYGLGGPEVGDVAPNFHLKRTDGTAFELASLRAKKPVVLVFGSFT